MSVPGFVLFDSAIGRCGIAWSERGIVGVQLPEGHELATRARLCRFLPGAVDAVPPAPVRRAIDGIVGLLSGVPSSLESVPLDLDGVPVFDRRVYEIARGIRPGWTLTYGEVAARLGAPGSAREVGRALARNPVPIIVPCHRVVASGGRVGGFSARGGVATKIRLLAIEGSQLDL